MYKRQIYYYANSSIHLVEHHAYIHISTRNMYDYEYPYDIEYSYDYLDEGYAYADDLDEDHPRDTHTWQEIAYMHFA